MQLSGKTVIIVGASSGLGKTLTELLAAEGAKVIGLSRTIADVELPASVVKIPLNIRDLKSIDAAWTAIDQETSKIDIIINCAGRALVKTLEETTRDEIMDVLGINLKGSIYMDQEAYKRMIPHQSGHIINIISTSGLRERELEPIYATSKWGLRGFTQSLRVAAQKHGIKVTSVYPGGMNSENFWKSEPDKDLSKFMKPADVAQQILPLLTASAGVLPAELVIERF
jgi:NAD(P)-dependent dehydrogenase (short-subunit alcohol dehydrogenase family)